MLARHFRDYSLKGRLRRPFARPLGVGGIIVKNTIGYTHLGQTDRHTYGKDRQTDTHMGQTDTHMGQTYRLKNSFYAKNFFCSLIPSLSYFLTPPIDEESIHVMTFEICP